MLDNLQKYITPKNMLFTIILAIFITLTIIMKDIAILFFASFVIACSLNPIVDKLSEKFSRNTSASIVLGSAILLICIIFIPLIALAGHEIKTFAISFPQYVDSIKDFALHSKIISRSDIAQLDIGEVVSSASGFASNFMNEVIDLSKHLGSALVYLLASLIIIYYLLADKEIIKNTYARLFPLNIREKAKEVLEIISQKIGGYVIGQIVAMAGVGIVMTVGLLILRVDYAVLLGLLTAILDLIPVVGPGIALVICLIAAYKSGPIVLALIVVVFAIAQISENNLVKPYVFGKLLNIHPIIIYLFLFITAKYMGVTGVIFAPAIAATVCVLVEELYIKNIEKEEEEE